jgi:hypothetical protein
MESLERQISEILIQHDHAELFPYCMPALLGFFLAISLVIVIARRGHDKICFQIHAN